MPVFDWVGAAANEARQHAGPVGIVATSGTLAAGVYQEAFEMRDVAYVTPVAAAQNRIMHAVYGSSGVKTLSRPSKNAAEALREAVELMVEAGAHPILLGCTELPMLASLPGWKSSEPIIDPGETAITRILDWFEDDQAGIRRDHTVFVEAPAPGRLMKSQLNGSQLE